MGLITSVLGGRPGVISGATGVVAVVIVSLAQSHGVEYVFVAAVLAGLIQITAGKLQWLTGRHYWLCRDWCC